MRQSIGLPDPATTPDEVDIEAVNDHIVSLASNADHENTTIDAVQSEAVRETAMANIQEIVRNEDSCME